MSTETMALTLENVEKVLDELRPFLMADGGNAVSYTHLTLPTSDLV
mgnify:CR=1 FL=1